MKSILLNSSFIIDVYFFNVLIIIFKFQGFLNQDATLTQLAKFAVNLPIDPYLSKMIFMALKLKCLDPILTLVSTMTLG